MYHYSSKVTQFIDRFLKDYPGTEEKRLKHRQRLWDVHLNHQERVELNKNSLLKCPYTYFPNPKPDNDSPLSD